MEPPDAVRSAPIAMTETSFLFIVPFLASMTNLPCCRVPAQLSMAYKEIFPRPASLTSYPKQGQTSALPARR